MSQPTVIAPSPSSTPAVPLTTMPVTIIANKVWWKHCAIVIGDLDGLVLGGKGLGASSDIATKLFLSSLADTDTSMGFSLEFPLGPNNEDEGFGTRHAVDRALGLNGRAVPTETHNITVKFPRDQFTSQVEAIEPSSHLSSLFPDSSTELSLLKVSVNKHAQCMVQGWAKDIVQMEWTEARLPPPFSYPYGTEYSWDEDRYKTMLDKAKGGRFAPAWYFDDDNAHLAVLTQSQVQDVFWVHQIAQDIKDTKFRAYFVPHKTKQLDQYYVIIPVTQKWRKQHSAAWRRLTQDEFLQLNLHKNSSDERPARWDARLMPHPGKSPTLSSHPLNKDDIVILVRRPLKEYTDRGPDFEVKRRVEAVCLFDPNATPTNVAACGMPTEVQSTNPNTRPITVPTDAQIRFRMGLHRDLMRGTGFYPTLRLEAKREFSHFFDHEARSLPMTNFLETNDERYIEALMMEALPSDRARFQKYLSKRPLGLGIITAGPGFGKTTALVVGTIAMSSLGKIYGSGPTHVAVENFSTRLGCITASVTNHYNKDKKADDPSRARRLLVIRGNKINDEVEAFFNLLKNPRIGNAAAPNRWWTPPSKWTMHLSLAFWFLVLLRSPGVQELHPDDSAAIFKLRDTIDKRDDLARLRAYGSGATVPRLEIEAIMREIVFAADIVCTTPARSCQEPYATWKNEHARGIAIDEAANISRPDLYTVWGNTLLPCLMAGDEMQLSPTMMTMGDKDAGGNLLNRLGNEGKISPLSFLKATGWPIYRLRTQLRMANGLFDLGHDEFYSDVPFEYGLGCEIDLPGHEIGRQLETFLNQRHPELTPAQPGKMQDVFVHLERSNTSVDKFTGSRMNRGQVKVALDLVRDFVKATKVSPARIIVITPYKANVGVIESMRKKSDYSINSGMQPAATVDSFQGREGDVAVVIMGTTRRSGPGFTTNEPRLNVMTSRQKSGLVIVGDINVVEWIDEGRRVERKQNQEDRDKTNSLEVMNRNGKKQWMRGAALHRVLTRIHKNGRMVRAPAPSSAEEDASI
ncbi:AAA domain-containing protein [Ilyonectria sp. MPI-CAGE-AT-0026]|nr:AAA domain-containing protein [Ilyonectria sp. MPI-CAGE-AT-0026]